MHTKWMLLACLIAGAAQAANQAGCTGAGDAELARGKHLAQLLCGACHVVGQDQEFPPYLEQSTPSFFDIAARPQTSAQSLRRFLTTTHWDQKTIPMRMPNPLLTEEQIRALSHYILCLRPDSH
jgi:hypothetical protein